MIEILFWVSATAVAFILPFLVLLQVSLLLGLLMFLLVRSTPSISRHKVLRWLVPAVPLGTLGILVVVFLRSSPTKADVISALFKIPIMNLPMLYLNVVSPILLLGIVAWKVRPLVSRNVLATYLCGSLLFAGTGFVSARYYFQLSRFETTLAKAFDGQVEPGSDHRYKFFCTGFDCEEILPRLPSVAAVGDTNCTTSMMRDDLRQYGHDVNIAGLGACCRISFGGLGDSEVHVYWTGARYEILLTEPRMRGVLKNLALKDGSRLDPQACAVFTMNGSRS